MHSERPSYEKELDRYSTALLSNDDATSQVAPSIERSSASSSKPSARQLSYTEMELDRRSSLALEDDATSQAMASAERLEHVEVFVLSSNTCLDVR